MKFEVYRDKADGYRWRLLADNGKIIADSAESYVDDADAIHAIALIRKGADSAELEFVPEREEP
jgi:uncharacterized protein YegP (UPF0339 family)